jgi:hypothetical protein
MVQYDFDDLGLADSASGMISFIIVYLIFSKRSMSYLESRNIAIWIFLIYSTQEILSYFFPFVGTFDLKDLLYYLIGLIIVFYFDIRKKRVYHKI